MNTFPKNRNLKNTFSMFLVCHKIIHLHRTSWAWLYDSKILPWISRSMKVTETFYSSTHSCLFYDLGNTLAWYLLPHAMALPLGGLENPWLVLVYFITLDNGDRNDLPVSQTYGRCHFIFTEKENKRNFLGKTRAYMLYHTDRSE